MKKLRKPRFSTRAEVIKLAAFFDQTICFFMSASYRVYVLQNLKGNSAALQFADAGERDNLDEARKTTQRPTRRNATHLCHADRSGDISHCLIPGWDPQLAIAHPFENCSAFPELPNFVVRAGPAIDLVDLSES